MRKSNIVVMSILFPIDCINLQSSFNCSIGYIYIYIYIYIHLQIQLELQEIDFGAGQKVLILFF